MKPLRWEELWVAGCVQAALSGVIVGQHDDNIAQNVHDLDLSNRGGRTFGAVEVTMAADGQVIAFLRSAYASGGRWTASGIVGGWQLKVRPSARVKPIFKELPLLLGALEQLGVTELPKQTFIAGHLATVAKELGIVRAYQAATNFPGSVYLSADLPLERTGGWGDPNGDALSAWITDWIVEPSRADNLRKLRRSAAAERHLAVIVPGLQSTVPFAVNQALMSTDPVLPKAAPVLPDEITHIWIVGDWQNGHGYRWSPTRGWQTFIIDAPVNEAALVECTC